MTRSTLTHLECSACGATYAAQQLLNLCPACAMPLLARYDLRQAAETLTPAALAARPSTLWRYEELLPVRDDAAVISLGEGWTPLLPARRLGERLGCERLYIKDESRNPTGSFKARGLCLAVSRAYELGARALAIPSAGNAGSALAAYAAAAGLPAHIFIPASTPRPIQVECQLLGAQVTLVDGLITDCGVLVREGSARHGWFDVSTLREPYRVEGKKTMGFELAEQLGWRLPDVIIYPTGGGTGLIAMWKAFDELEQLGLIDARRPRMVSVQSDGCAPIVRAFAAGEQRAAPWQGAQTVASGLLVPAAIGDFLILRALRASGGLAVAVSDAEMLACTQLLGATTGLFAAPEGAACLAALTQLRASGWVAPAETVVMFATGTGLKYTELWDERAGAA